MELDFDLIFVIGLVIAAFAIPSLVSAFSDRRWPKLAVLMLLIGGGLIGYAVSQNPDTYSVAVIPDVFVRVVGSYIN
ncbi:hypothetical protein ACJ5NV_10965 [Loktanella agnita]|uniref:hypothetical protein n=1 Tax=Loktanella agnita TaxID=287097 RepID=UPI003985C97C